MQADAASGVLQAVENRIRQSGLFAAFPFRRFPYLFSSRNTAAYQRVQLVGIDGLMRAAAGNPKTQAFFRNRQTVDMDRMAI